MSVHRNIVGECSECGERWTDGHKCKGETMWNVIYGVFVAALVVGLVVMIALMWWSSRSPNTPVTQRMHEQTPGHIGYPYNGITAITIHSQGRVIPCVVASQTVAGSNPAVSITCDWGVR